MKNVFFLLLTASLFLNARADYRSTIQAEYQNSTSNIVKARLAKLANSFSSALNKRARDYFDLGILANKQNKPAIAQKMFLEATTLQPENPLYLAWLAHIYLQRKPVALADLQTLEQELEALTQKTNEHFLAEVPDTKRALADLRAQIKHKQSEFNVVRDELMKIGKENPNDSRIEGMGNQLTAINEQIRQLDQTQTEVLASLRRPTDFELRTLATIQKELARIAMLDQKMRLLNKAQKTIQLGTKQPLRPFARDYKSLATLRMEKARVYDRLYRTNYAKAKNSPVRQEKNQWQKKYDQVKLELPRLKTQAEQTFQAAKNGPEMQALEQEVQNTESSLTNQKTALTKSRAELDTLNTSIQSVQTKIRNTRNASELATLRSQETDLLQKYNQTRTNYNQQVNQYNATIGRINTLQKEKNTTLDRLYKEAFQPFNDKVTLLNDVIVPNLNLKSKELADLEHLWREPLFERDQEWALARTELLFATNNNKLEPELVDMFNNSENRFTVLENHKPLYSKRPWCAQVDLHCGSCFGLAVLGCYFREMDVRSRCAAGKPYSVDRPAMGTGGMIGKCGGLVAISDKEFLASMADDQEYPNLETFAERKKRLEAEEMAEAIAAELFSDSEEADKPKTLEELINKLRESESNKELAALLEMLEERKSLTDNWNVDELIDQLRSERDPEQRRKLFKGLYEQIMDAATNLTKMTAVEALTSKDAERLTDIAKYGAILLDDLKDPTGQTDTSKANKLLTVVHGVSALASGAKNKDAEKIMDGLRDTIGSVPGMNTSPVLVAIDIPGEVAGSMINNTRKGWEQSASAMNEVANAINGDPHALERIEHISRDLERTLSPKTYGEGMMNAIKRRIVDRIPVVRTIVNWFTS